MTRITSADREHLLALAGFERLTPWPPPFVFPSHPNGAAPGHGADEWKRRDERHRRPRGSGDDADASRPRVLPLVIAIIVGPCRGNPAGRRRDEWRGAVRRTVRRAVRAAG